MIGKEITLRARAALDAAEKILAIDPPDDVPVLVALLELSLDAEALREFKNVLPVPDGKLEKVEGDLAKVQRVLRERLAVANTALN